MPMWVIWLILCGVFLLIEIFTVTFLMFWPGIGAFLAFITSLLTPNVTIQIAVFAISSTLMIIFMKPLVKKLFKTADVPMNKNALVGKKGIVIKEIDNINSKGQVKINGELWSAKSVNNTIIPEKEYVTIESVEGVKLIVKKVS